MGLGDARPLMESSLEAVDIGTASTSNGDIGGVQGIGGVTRFVLTYVISDTTCISFTDISEIFV